MGSPITRTKYDNDFAKWAEETAELIRTGCLDEVDLEHVAEEIEGLSRSDQRALGSQLQRIILHLLKIQYQPECHTRRWDLTIRSARNDVRELLQESRSLVPKVPELIRRKYDDARVEAEAETGLPLSTFPEECPFTEAEVLG